MPSISSLVLALSAAAVSMASSHGLQSRNHHELAKRAEENMLSKRFFSPRCTWYPTDTGPDACTGRNHGDYDNVIALNTVQWEGGKHCGKNIKITANGKTFIGVIQDLCASCNERGMIDLTKGGFQHFYSLDKGVFEASWEFLDGSGGGDSHPPPPPPPPPPKHNNPKPPPKAPEPKPTPPPAKFVAPKPPKKSSSKPKSSSAKPSSSVRSSSSVRPSSSSSAPVVVPSVPVPVGNVGDGPTEDSTASINGGISSDDTLPGNGAMSVTFNRFVAGAAAALLVAQAL